MKPLQHLRKCLSAGPTAGILALAVVIANRSPTPAFPDQGTPADLRQRDTNPEWPMLGGGPSRNMIHVLEKNIPDRWNVDPSQSENIRWKAQVGSRLYGGPVVSGGKVYVGTNNGVPRNPRIKGDKGILMCFREADGQFLWQAVHDKLSDKVTNWQVHDWPNQGIASSPVVEGDRLYYVSNRAEVICADTEGFLDGRNDGWTGEKYRHATDADIIWRLDMIEELKVFPHNLANCSPLIVGDLLFVVTSNGVDWDHVNLPAPEAPSFLALNKKTGKVAWQSNAPTARQVGVAPVPVGGSTDKLPRDQEGVVMHSQWSNPAYAETNGVPQVIFPGGDGWLRAFEPATGKLLWKFDCNLKAARYELGGKGTRSDFMGTPAVYRNKLYIGTGQDPEHYEGEGRLWCIDLVKAVMKGRSNKDNDVSFVKDNLDPAAAVNRDSALAWHFGGPRPQPHKRDWYFGRTMSTCAVHDGLVYAAELPGYLHCLDADTGKPYWVHDLRSSVWSSPLYVDGKVFLGNEDGEVLVFAHGKEKIRVGTMPLDHAVKANLAVANGVLFVPTEPMLYAIGRKQRLR